jgi:saccharopine dehydrogenase-like NADP-dependent oxidoreductase
MDSLALLTALGLADTAPVELPGGPVVPRQLLVHCITTTATMPGPESAPDDAEAIWVRVRGRRAGPSGDPALAPRERSAGGAPVERLAECVVRPHPTWQAGAGQLDTGAPPSIVAQFLAAKLIDRPGVLAPEDAVPPEPFLAELAARNMEVTMVTRERSLR